MFAASQRTAAARAAAHRTGVLGTMAFASSPRAPLLLQLQRRAASSAAFAQRVEALQAEYKRARSPHSIAELRAHFEKEPIVDAAHAMTPAMCTTICDAAAAHRINPAACAALQDICQWAVQPSVTPTMDIAAIARLCHCCVALHAPLTFEVLFTYLWRVVELAPSMDAPTLCAIINAYGRGGVKHKRLFQVLVARARVVLARANTEVTLANVANTAHALSRVDAYDATLFADLADHATRLQAKGTPLAVTTILDAFAKCGAIDAVLFETYEALALKQAEQFPPALLAAMLHVLSTAGRVETPLFAALTARSVKLAAQFDAASVAKTLTAFRMCGKCSEELFGALAERSCAIPHEFRLNETREVLEALAHFELFDAELFPLLSARVVSLLRQKGSAAAGSGVADVGDAVGVLASFAAVRERREDLVSHVIPLLTAHLTAMSPATLLDAVWALDALNVRGEVPKTVAAAARDQHYALRDYALSSEKGSSAAGAVVRQRWELVARQLRVDVK